MEVGAGSDEGGIESGLRLGFLFEGGELGVGDVDSAVEDEGAEGVVGDGHLLVAVADEEGEVPRGGEGLGSGGEVGEGEGVEGEVRERGAEDEPGHDEDDAEDDGEANHGGEEGAEEGAGGVGAGRGVIGVVVLGLGVGTGSGGIRISGGGRRRLTAVGVVERRSGVAGGGARRILHNVTEQQSGVWSERSEGVERLLGFVGVAITTLQFWLFIKNNTLFFSILPKRRGSLKLIHPKIVFKILFFYDK